MLRILLVPAFATVLYFTGTFAVGSYAASQSVNPANASRAAARAVESYRPLIVGGSIVLGLLAALVVPTARPRRPVDPAEAAVYHAPNPLPALIAPAIGVCAFLAALGTLGVIVYQLRNTPTNPVGLQHLDPTLINPPPTPGAPMTNLPPGTRPTRR